MTRAVASVVLTVSSLMACVPSPRCLVDAALPDAGAPSDGGADAPSAPDASAPECPLITPTLVTLDHTWIAMGPGDTRDCFVGALRVRFFLPGGSTPVFDTLPRGPAACVEALENFERREYDVVVESTAEPQWIVGASVVRPESCVGAEASAPYCRPLRLVVDQCTQQGFFVVLHCDPHLGPCPDVTWPWSTPP